jgi:hypothetical protein
LTDNAWITDLFRSIDAKDTGKFVGFLTEDGQFRFGNAPPAIGRAAITALLDGFFGSIKGLRHDVANTWTMPDHVICEGMVTYTRHDGSTLSVPFVDIFAMRGKLIKDYLIYIDASQLYAPK